MARYIVASSNKTSVLANWYARSFIAGRDGTIVTTRPSQRTNPVDGTLLPVNTPATTQISIAGLSLNMYGVFGQRTNILTNSGTMTGTGWALNTNSTITIDGTSSFGNLPSVLVTEGSAGNSFILSNIFSITSGQVLTGSCFVKRGNADWVKLNIQNTPNSSPTEVCRQWFNVNTGTLGQGGTLGGNVSILGASIITAGNGWYKLSLTATLSPSSSTAAFGTTSALSNGSTSRALNSTRLMAASQFETGLFPGPFIPTISSSTTHNADIIQWNLPISWDISAGEVTSFIVPYCWNASAGGLKPDGVSTQIYGDINSGNQDLLNRGTSDLARHRDASAGATDVVVASLADSHGTVRMLGHSWNTTSVKLYQGSTTATTNFSINPPWFSRSSLLIGSKVAAGSEFYGFIGLVYTPGGLTNEERIALNSLKQQQIIFTS